MDRNQPGIAGAEKQTGLIDATAALFKGKVLFFWNQEFCIDASELEVFHHGSGNFAVVLVLTEASVGRAFAGGYFPRGRCQSIFSSSLGFM